MLDKLKNLIGQGTSAQRFAEAIYPSAERGQIMFWMPEDTRLQLDSYTRSEINRKVDWLYQHFGVVKEGVHGIARHVVGKGIELQLDTDDAEWNVLAEEDFERYACTPDRVDAAGRRNFYELQECAVEQRLLRGEFFGIVAQNPRWKKEPCLRVVDSLEISTPTGYRGEDVFDGVKLDGNTHPLAYYFRPPGGKEHLPIPAANMIHWYRPVGVNQVRGESDFAQSVTRLMDIHELTKLTTSSAKLHAALAVMVKRNAAGPGSGAIGKFSRSGDQPADDTRSLEKVFGGGAIAYVGSEGDIKLVSSNSPSPLVEPFITDLLMRDVCLGWGVPPEFFWAVAKMSSANTRFILSRADLMFQVLQDRLIYNVCLPFSARYLAHRQATGALRECRDPRWAEKISWQSPARITVDNGRDGALEINQLENAIVTYRDTQDKRGKNWRTQLRQYFKELAFAKMAAEAAGVPEEYHRWRPMKPGAAPSMPAGKREEEEEEEEEEES